MRRHTFVTCLLLVPLPGLAAEFVVPPFLQDVTPTSARLVWESDADVAAAVSWGPGAASTAPALPSERVAQRRVTPAGTWIHEVQLDALTPESRITYRVTLDEGPAAEADFQVPPAARGDRTFRLVAMSDMQRASNAPGKWAEVVNEGVLAWAEAQWGADIAAQFAMVLLPGDLVDDGEDHAQWTDDFFGPVSRLSAHMPVYPVLGNHESNADWYFDYFHLPENGDPTLPDQWWSTRYENLLVVGLDSNQFLLWADQMAWLDLQLDAACDDPELDFVLAQLHHPWQSEAWVPGESPLTGQLVQRLADWSLACNKPSLHLFGHTHAYSRGQLRDAPHLLVNVATGGGAIDRWGEHLQRNYDTFTVSSDDWGFVVLDVASGDDPQVRVRRFSRGDADTPLDNVLTDEIVVRRYPDAPAAPVALAPHGDVDGACVALQVSPFTDPDGGTHQATHWQLVQGCTQPSEATFALPTQELWRQDRDLYFDVDGQLGDDLTEDLLRGLAPGEWCWRARVRDDGLAWSPWSTPARFTVTTTGRTANLLPESGGEQDAEGWLVDVGRFEITGAARCGAPPPHQGSRALALGGRCTRAEQSAVRAVVPVADLDAPEGSVVHLALAAQGEVPLAVGLRFTDAEGRAVGGDWDGSVPPASAWARSTWEVVLPAGAATVTLVLAADGIVDLDAIDLSVGAPGALDCTPRFAPEAELLEDEAEPPGCGCGTVMPSVAWAWAVLGVFGLRRRQQGPRIT